jgi:hypothetical protein
VSHGRLRGIAWAAAGADVDGKLYDVLHGG